MCAFIGIYLAMPQGNVLTRNIEVTIRTRKGLGALGVANIAK